jgi:hypothetical protein
VLLVVGRSCAQRCERGETPDCHELEASDGRGNGLSSSLSSCSLSPTTTRVSAAPTSPLHNVDGAADDDANDDDDDDNDDDGNTIGVCDVAPSCGLVLANSFGSRSFAIATSGESDTPQ